MRLPKTCSPRLSRALTAAGWVLALSAIVTAVGSHAGAASAESPTKTTTIDGKLVQFRTAAMAATKLEWVDGVGADLLALQDAAGKLTPILPTETGRFFYKDRSHIGRMFRVTGIVRPQLPGIEIAKVQTQRDGKVCDIYYWCDICAIKMYRHGDCTCCQGPVELRETVAAP